MSNQGSAFGFVPIGTTDGSDYHGKLQDVTIDDTTASFIGDMMVFGTNVAADENLRVASAAGVAPAGNTFVGGLVEIYPDFTDEGTLISNFAAAGAGDRQGRVAYGNEVIYASREDALVSVIDGVDIGGSVDILTTAGDQITGISAHALDSSTSAADLVQAMRIERRGLQQGTELATIGGVGAIWEVRINPVA